MQASFFIWLPVWTLSLGCASDKDDPAELPDETSDSTDSTESGVPLDTRDSGKNTPKDTGEPLADPVPDMVLAVIGDYGMNNADEAAVAALVHSWEPDFVLTTGDNNYPSGEADTIDANIGQYYQQYIHPYVGKYGDGAEVNAFFPCPGNHDWFGPDEITPYTEYFELPGNERYYEVSVGKKGLLDVFCVDSDTHEPDGVTADSVQASWLEEALSTSTATWRMVTLHHSPYSSGVHQDQDALKWPYGAWGAQMVLGGHDHNYERIVENDMLYTVNGAGGAALRSVQPPTTGTQVWDVSHHGAQRIRIYGDWLIAEFIGTNGELIDQVHLHADHHLDASSYLVTPGASWRYLDTGVEPDPEWIDLDFDDQDWSEGSTPLGYGISGIATSIDYGDDPDNRHPTTWLRHSFQVDDPNEWSQLTLHLRRDDGARIFLNGSEVLSSNLPAEVDADSLAVEDVQGTEESAFLAESLDPNLLSAGENILAVEVHQASADSEDLVFELRLEVEGGDEIISSGDHWEWTTDEPDHWTVLDFDSSDWSTGPSPLGFGIGNEGTETTQGTTTTWFRHEFEVEDPADIEILLLQLKRDDGARVTLNGREILRSNLPEIELSADTLAHTEISDVWQTSWQSSHVDPALLVAGTNVIGVEVHQVSKKDSDLSMDLKLIRR